MPVVMIMSWDGMNKADYESLRKTVNLEEGVPKGSMFYVADLTTRAQG